MRPPRRLDEPRVLWAAGDIVENRPPLSRWHPDYTEAFAAFVKKESIRRRKYQMRPMPRSRMCHSQTLSGPMNANRTDATNSSKPVVP